MTDLAIVNSSIERIKDRIIKANDSIHEFAELAYEEYKSAALLTEILKEEGFEVETGLADMPTCFTGSCGEGRPVIGILGEFDALDKLSQCTGVSERMPETCGAPGHGCGHNSLGTGALAAAIAVKDYLESTGEPGTVIYFGCPAEEGDGAKQFMARAGLFDDVDFVYTWHPSYLNEVSAESTTAIMGANFSFEGTAAHAGSDPWLGRSGLDAAELMNVGCNYLREHIRDGERIHYAFMDAGGSSANVVPAFAKIKYEVRSAKVDQLKELFARVVKVAEGAAHMTETKMSYEISMAFSDFQNNSVLAEVASKAMQDVGAPVWDDSDYKMAKEFLESYEDDTKASIKEGIKTELGADRIEELWDRPLHDEVIPYNPRNGRLSGGSSDVGDVSYTVPTCEIHMSTCALGTVCHTWQMTGQSATEIAHKGLLAAAKVIALSCIRTKNDPELIERARAETIERNGGRYDCPLPDEVRPPVK